MKLSVKSKANLKKLGELVLIGVAVYAVGKAMDFGTSKARGYAAKMKKPAATTTTEPAKPATT